MMIENREDLLKCRRNELAPDNPGVYSRGIEGLMEYRLNDNKRNPLSLYRKYCKEEHKYCGRSKTAEYFEELYGIDPFAIGSSDMIFDCWSFLSRFFRGMAREFWPCEEVILDNLDFIFEGYEELRRKLDKLADYQYCLANLMPAPVGFGKMDHTQKRRWIDENMEDLSLQVFCEYEPFCEDANADEPVTDDPVELIPFMRSVDNAIVCIEYRSMKLINRYYKKEGRNPGRRCWNDICNE